MKVKELEKTVNLAWSPKSQYPILLAAGTAAQQFDASFSTNAVLELYSVNLSDSSLDLELCSSSPSKNRFHKLIWGPYESGSESGKGVIVGGCDAGQLVIYNAAQLLNNETGIVACTERHSGPVRALDFNSFQKNLLASGASESEIFIWDLNNLTTPMTPGAISQPTDDIISLSWNKQVQHILATTFPTKCTVWDLRKNEPIIKLTDSSSKIRWKVVAWNPQVATQLCLASEEDACPIIQLWDLRFATTPIKVFEGHNKGILSAAWCDEDPDLLVSCGKDNKMLVWNLHTDAPNGEIILCDMPLNTQWNFEVNWCPRNPFLISTSSFDSRATVYSLSGGQPAAPTSNKIADSFPGMNHYPQSLPPQQVHQQQQPVELLKPPKWMKKPCGVSFAFGGKLLSFNSSERTVYVSQVVTEPDLMMKFRELLDSLEQNNLFNHCYKKVETTADPQVKEIWNFIACQFYGESFRNQVCAFLGITPAALNDKLLQLNIKLDENSSNDFSSNVSRIGPADADPFDLDNHQDLSINSTSNGVNEFQILKKPFKISEEVDLNRAVSEALLLDNKELAVDLLIKQNRTADAIILALSGGPDLLAKAQSKYFEKSDDSITALVSAVVNKDWCNIVETCDLANWKEVLIALLYHTKDNEFRTLCEILGQRLLVEGDCSQKKSALLCYVCSGDVNELLNNWNTSLTSSPADIQDLVELGLIMKEAVKSRGVDVGVSGALAKVLVQYAELLASQGYLTEAYTYLGEASDEENVTMLKDRLACVLGLPGASYVSRPAVSAPEQNSYLPSQMMSQPQHPYPSSAASFPPLVSQFNNVMQPLSKPPVKQVHPQPTINKPQPIKAFSQQPLHQPQPTMQQPHIAQISPSMPVPSSQFNSFQQPAPVISQPTPSYPSSANLFQPLAPSGPSPLAAPPLSTGQMGPPPLQSTFNPSANSHFSQFKAPAVGPPAPVATAASSGLPPMARSTPTPPAPPLSSQVPYNSARQTPDHLSAQGRSKYVLDPSVRGGGGPRGSFSNSFQPLPQMGNSLGNHAPVNSVPPFSSHNDSSFYDFSQQNSTYGTSAPVNPSSAYAPSPAINPNSPYIPNPPNPVPSIMQPNAPSMPTMPQPSQKPAHSATAGWNDPPPVIFEKPTAPPHQVTPGMALPPSNHSPYQNNINRATAAAAAEPHQKQSVVLPEQHMHLQTVFNELQSKCFNKTSNPQMKRKLDDVVRKLEMMYEAIRDNRLSPQTLAGLHEVVNAIQQGNYQGCLTLHTQLVNSSDFAVIASFMPGIKVLVQSALQLDVYV